ESCGTTYEPTELRDPYCAVCHDKGTHTIPEVRDSEHLFVPLERYKEFLVEWLGGEGRASETTLQSSVRNYLLNWVEDLKDWDISREAPYFGFEIPGHPGKFFYVWFDAPIGYIAATDKWCADHGRDFDAYWKSDRTQTEIVHVIGKDIVYFHALFWPAMLHAAGYTTPSRIQVHGWLTVNGEKMSKSRGTFILARTYLDHLSPEYLRYYFAAKLSSTQDDFNLDLEDFVARVNADLVNKAANLASRCTKFLTGKLDGAVADIPEDARAIIEAAESKLATVPDLYRNFESASALRVAMEIAEAANVYLTEQEPWKLAKSDPERARAILSVGIHASKLVGAILTPVIPSWGEKLQRIFQLDAPIDFDNATQRLAAGHSLGAYEALAERIDPKVIAAILEASKEDLQATDAASSFDYEVPALADEIKIDAFTPMDLRVGEVTAVEAVEGSDKLLKFTVNLGPLGTRTIFSGIKPSYGEDASLVGRHVVVLANLKPR
ncbi:MAG: methionine--tRNA ligase, partial [Nannocystaceae bacterium]